MSASAVLSAAALVQQRLWSADAEAWRLYSEPHTAPLFDAVLAAAEVGPGVRVLDVACGTGMLLALAAERGAEVSGLELNLAHDVQPPELRAALGVAPGAVSHTSWWTTDLAAETAHLESAGCALLTTSAAGAVANWFAGGSLFAHPIEIHQPTPGVLGMWGSLHEGSIS